MIMASWNKNLELIVNMTAVMIHLGFIYMAATLSYNCWVFWQAGHLPLKAVENMLIFGPFFVFVTWATNGSWRFVWSIIKYWTRTLLTARSDSA